MTIDEAIYTVLAECPLEEIEAAVRSNRLETYLRSQTRVTEYSEDDFEPSDPPSYGGDYSQMEVAARKWSLMQPELKEKVREFLENKGFDWEDWVFHLDNNLIHHQPYEPDLIEDDD